MVSVSFCTTLARTGELNPRIPTTFVQVMDPVATVGWCLAGASAGPARMPGTQSVAIAQRPKKGSKPGLQSFPADQEMASSWKER
jgi:hypothetical protein